MNFASMGLSQFFDSAENPTVLDSHIQMFCNTKVSSLTNKTYDGFKAFEMWKSLLIASKFLKKPERIFFSSVYNEEALHLLSMAGYKKLVAMDKDLSIYDKRDYWKIKYFYGDILKTHLPNSFFKAIFSLGAIEHLIDHGKKIFDKIDLFFEESRRILSNNGILVITTNFGERFTRNKGNLIFDKEGIRRIIQIAEAKGFSIFGESSFNIFNLFVNRNLNEFTSIFLAFHLQKTEKINELREICIVSPMIKQDGITIYSENLRKKFENIGVRVNLVSSVVDCINNTPIIFQYDPGLFQRLPKDIKVLIEMHSSRLTLRGITYVTIKSRSIKKGLILLMQLLSISRYHLLIRNNEIAKVPTIKIKNYSIVPHLAYPDLHVRANPTEIFLGSFGFALPFKRFQDVCELAIRLNVRCKILLTINNASDDMLKTTTYTARSLIEEYSSHSNIEIKSGFFTEEEILNELSLCSHILFAQKETYQTSGSYRFPTQLRIPVIAVESFQARESQVHRVKSLNDITIDLLKKLKDPVDLDDGFDYLIAILRNSN